MHIQMHKTFNGAMICCVFIVLVLIGSVEKANCQDTCDGPFSEFIGCLSVQLNNKIQSLEAENTPNVQNKIANCFKQNNCVAPDFSSNSVGRFLSEPWSSRVSTVLSLLEDTSPRVQQCMVHYFSGIAQRKIQACVRQYGAADVRNFEMPQLSDLRGLDISKLKFAVLNRMAVTKQMMECSKIVSNDETLQQVIDCTKAARITQPETSACRAKESCQSTKITGLICTDRFEKVQKGACECFDAEQRSTNSTVLANWKELKDSLFQGGMEKEYRKCHERNNLPYPQEKVDAAKKAVKQAVGEVLLRGQLPDDVRTMMRILAESLREMKGTLVKTFCQKCQDENTLSRGEEEAVQIRSLAGNQQAQPDQQTSARNADISQPDFLGKLRQFFGN